MSTAIAIDYSGSCADLVREYKIIEQLREEFGHTQVRLIFFNHRVVFDQVMNLHEFNLEMHNFFGGVGDMDALSRALKLDPDDHLILITDGYLHASKGCMARTAGVITIRMYEEIDEHEMKGFKAQLGHENIFMEILEPPEDSVIESPHRLPSPSAYAGTYDEFQKFKGKRRPRRG